MTTDIQWIWPPNYDGNPPDRGGFKKVKLHLTGVALSVLEAGEEETDVVKLDISELRKTNGDVPTRTAIESLSWGIDNLNYVLLEWDRAPDNTIAVLSGQGEINSPLVDESDGTDGTGNILLTTSGVKLGSSYDITMTVQLK
jgi:hypothetical protein